MMRGCMGIRNWRLVRWRGNFMNHDTTSSLGLHKVKKDKFLNFIPHWPIERILGPVNLIPYSSLIKTLGDIRQSVDIARYPDLLGRFSCILVNNNMLPAIHLRAVLLKPFTDREYTNQPVYWGQRGINNTNAWKEFMSTTDF
jgi:hypothetical protein